MRLRILDVGSLSTIQDAGRYGFRRYGMPVSGPMDWFAFQVANRLVGNSPADAVIEFSPGGLTFTLDADGLIAVTGSVQVWVDQMPLPGWMAIRVRRRQEVRVMTAPYGCWGYLAVAGGILTPPVLGSRATFLRGRLGGMEGRPLEPGDCILCGEGGKNSQNRAGYRLMAESIPAYSQRVTVRVMPGPQYDWFEEARVETFFRTEFRVDEKSDRMGFRLIGTEVQPRARDLLSEGMLPGSIQVPPDGQPIVLMADSPTTGGYPKIATLIRADLPVFAQLRPGEGRVRFKVVTPAQARKAYLELLETIDFDWEEDHSLWMTA
ncbi:biotin-dependent carboxylase [Anaerolinea thermolimosa]|uniref:5-oxoprolinase subunit C family protein n=1 Tax=Anaerolinea thermolimosa TaxID=229919 RepID=UPI000784A53B|nr:biotin-dependent carboxyltransferase family protein [Anaerolinea thermolimosa]GAP06094.1 biotin-dependent carboxylase [Anaerolinea thermolimosa]